ncbi:MAG: dihydropteroate synthase [Chitinophagia bacterium]|nr:dihydropteroate synthase [Chitinophagia bacterium]
MGILNATPNSFYNKGKESDTDSLLRKAEQMLDEGATILDIGGASTKPGEPIIDPQIEQARVLNVIDAIRSRFPDTWLSIDTYHASTAYHAITAGADIVNDISAGQLSENMLKAVSALKVPYIAMHIKGTPATMQTDPHYNHLTLEVLEYFTDTLKKCTDAGIYDVIIDPGFGFGKTIEHNYLLLKNLSTLQILQKPILVGISRKSMVYKPLKLSAEEALNGTTALHIVALQQGANILRVHDVKEAVQCINLWQWL